MTFAARPVKRAAKAGREAAKQQRTVTHINDKGEEVTEVVLEAAEDSSRQQGSADATGMLCPSMVARECQFAVVE